MIDGKDRCDNHYELAHFEEKINSCVCNDNAQWKDHEYNPTDMD
jgi:hypothetical protein